VRQLCLVAALVSVASACAHRAGREATQGALAELQEQQAQANARGGPPPSAIIAHNTIDGVMTALDTPEQQARIQRLVSLAVAAATKTVVADMSDQLAAASRTMVDSVSEQLAGATRNVVDEMTDQLIAELGPDGSGRLAVSLSQAGQRVATSVAGGMVGGVANGVNLQLDTLFPDCTGSNRAACLNDKLQQTARTTAASFSKGVHDTIGWQLLVAAFALGAAGGVIGSWLVSLRHERRSFRTRTA
jgi:hypothetical protein